MERLVDALDAKKLWGFGADVFEVEPLPKDSPLWEIENCYITPHIAALIDRAVWRWAVRIEQESKAGGEEFFSLKRKEELAAFVRVLADDAFEQSDEIMVTFNERKERRQKDGGRVPTK